MRRLILVLAALASALPVAAAETLDHGRFERLQLLRPAGAARSFALLLTDRGGDRAQLAQALTQEGALVAVIDTEAFLRRMERDGGDCQFANGDVENLSRHMQAYAQISGYYPPILVGQGIGAGLAYGLMAQSAAGMFTAGLGLDFCPRLATRQPLCKGDSGLRLKRRGEAWDYQPSDPRAPLALLQSPAADCEVAVVERFARRLPQAALGRLQHPPATAPLRAAYRRLAADLPAPAVSAGGDVADLPLVEVPTQQPGRAFAVFLSGDGGWAGLDKEVAARLAARGVPVVGVDSLRYFWKARTPDSAAQDIARLIAHYQARWQRREVWLVGYSQGGDVLPFILNRLSPALRAQVRVAVPMAQTQQAHFEFHLSNWIGAQGTHPILPEMQRLDGVPELTMICAQAEQDSVCRALDPQRQRIVWLPGGHHFNGDYAALAQVILKAGAH